MYIVLCVHYCLRISVFRCFLCLFVDFPSVLWYCWLGLLTCKNCLPYNLYCVGGDVKHCSLTHAELSTNSWNMYLYMSAAITEVGEYHRLAWFCMWVEIQYLAYWSISSLVSISRTLSFSTINCQGWLVLFSDIWGSHRSSRKLRWKVLKIGKYFQAMTEKSWSWSWKVLIFIRV